MSRSAGDRPPLVRQLLTLWRFFLSRFFESDLTSRPDDFRLAFFALIALLSVPGVIAPILLAGANGAGPDDWGWAALARHAGASALRQASLPYKIFYLGFAMATAGVLTVLAWRNLLPSRDEGVGLSALPVSATRTIVARLLAFLSFIGLLTTAIHLLPSITFGVLLATGSSFGFALRGIAAHFVASVAASVFASLAVVAVQGLLVAPRSKVLSRLAPALQWTAPALVAAVVLSLPVLARDMSAVSQGSGPVLSWIARTPQFWFLGVYEDILGAASPALRDAAFSGWSALCLVAVVAIASFVHAYRAADREALAIPRRWDGSGLIGRWCSSRLASAVTGHPGAQAVVRFYLLILMRGARQRAAIACALGATVAWSLPGFLAMLLNWGAPPRPEVLAWPFTMLVFAVAGLRAAAALPVDQRSDWMFEFLAPAATEVRRAIGRTMFCVAVVPIVLCSTVVYWRGWGFTAAFAHLVTATSFGALLVEIFIWRGRRIPGTGLVHLDLGHLRFWWPAYLMAFSAATTGIGAIEYLLLDAPISSLLVAGYFLLVARLIRRYAASGLDTDAEPVSLRTGAAHEPWYSGINFTLTGWFREVHFAARRLARSPVYAVTSVLTLALGVGVTTAAWVVLSGSASPAGITQPSRVFLVEPRPTRAISWPDYVDLRKAQTSFSTLEAWSDFPAAVSWRGSAFLTEGTLVTGGFFQALGIAPVAGRLLWPSDDRPDAPRVAVLSERVWRRHFDERADLIGEAVHVGEDLYEVIGIAPASFRGLAEREPGVYVPVSQPPLTNRELAALRDRGDRTRAWLHAFGRLASGVTDRQAQDNFASLGRSLDASRAQTSPRPAGQSGGRSWSITPVAQSGRGRDGTRTGWLLFLVPAAVLLIACTNLASLALSRGTCRYAEFALRRALGASRWTLLLSPLMEVGILVAVGGALAWVVASAILAGLARFVTSTFGYSPQWQAPDSVGWESLPFVGAVIVCCLFVAGFLPAVQLTRRPLRDGRATASFASSARGLRHLVSGQVALSMMLLLVAALATRAIYADGGELEPDYPLSRLGIVSVPFELHHRDEAVIAVIANDVVQRAAPVAGVDAITVVSALPGVGGCCVELATNDLPTLVRGTGSVVAGTHNMFDALGLEVIRGRHFRPDDDAGPAVVAISDSYARRLYGSTNPIGHQVVVGHLFSRAGQSRTMATIVGIVRDVRSARTGALENIAYVLLSQSFQPNLTFVARADKAQPGAVAQLVAGILRDRDPRAAPSYAGPADLLAGGAHLTLRGVAAATSVLSLVALILSMTGLYGLLSHAVESRRFELGVRLALGGAPNDLVRLILLDGARATGVGIAAGVGLAALARASAQPLLVRFVTAVDGMSILMVAIPILSAAALACFIPARRASRTDPLVVMRAD